MFDGRLVMTEDAYLTFLGLAEGVVREDQLARWFAEHDASR